MKLLFKAVFQIIQILLRDKLNKFADYYRQIYIDGRGTIYHLQALGMNIPNEFKLAAQYTLSQNFNELVSENHELFDENSMQKEKEILAEAKMLGITLDKKVSNDIYTKKLLKNIYRLVNSLERQQANVIMDIFSEIDALELEIDLKEAQNLYFNKIYAGIIDILEGNEELRDKKLIQQLLDIGTKLNINTEFYKVKLEELK